MVIPTIGTTMFSTLFVLLSEGLFLLTILMHLARKNQALVSLYLGHSVVLALMLLTLAVSDRDPSLLIVVGFTFAVKVVFVSQYFGRLFRSRRLSTASGSYLTLPLTLLTITAIAAFAHAARFQPMFAGDPTGTAALVLSSILIAFFLTINRQGALSQIIGVLALENGIIALAALLGLKQTLTIELGLAFDLAVWIIVAVVFVGMVQQQFGSLSTIDMDHLKEE